LDKSESVPAMNDTPAAPPAPKTLGGWIAANLFPLAFVAGTAGQAAEIRVLQSGAFKRALVIGSETFSRIIDWKDRTTCVLFGDGAGAVVLEAQLEKGTREDRGILSAHLRSDGRHKTKLYVDGGPSSTQTVGHLRMEGRAVFKHAVAMITDVIEDAFKATGYTVKDINWLHGVTRISWLPFRDYEFRRAWHHSFDRKFLVDVVWEGAGRLPAGNTFLVDSNPWTNPNLPPVPEFNLDKARQILKDAGYRWAADGRLMYPAPNDEKWKERVRTVVKPGAGYTWRGINMIES